MVVTAAIALARVSITASIAVPETHIGSEPTVVRTTFT